MTERNEHFGTEISEKGISAQNQSLRLVRDLIRSLGSQYWFFFLLTIIFGLVSLLPAQFFRFFTESAYVLTPASLEPFIIRLALFGMGVALALWLSSFGTSFCQEWLRLKLGAELRRRALHSLHGMSIETLDQAQRGEWYTRLTGDLANAESFLTESVPSQIRSLTVLTGSGVLFLLYSGHIALLALCAALGLACLNFFLQRKLAPMLKELRDLHGGVFQLLIENLEGLRTVRSHNAEPYFERRFEGKLQLVTSKSLGVVRSLGILLGGNEFFGHVAVVLCLVLATVALGDGRLTLNEILIYPFFIGLFYGSAQNLAHAAYNWNRFFNEGGRLAEMLYRHGHEAGRQSRFSLVESVGIDEISLNNWIVGHEGRAVAGPLNLRFQRATILAIVGPSGCGKSTFLETLAGLRAPLAGQAQLLDEKGERRLCVPALRRLPAELFAYVEQRPYIFEGTIRENLTFGNTSLGSEATLWSCLEAVGLFQFVKSAGGLNHILRDRGKNLSEGERYRMALCRALLLKRPFLLLDEPFGALDRFSIETICKTLNEQKLTKGIAVVTHYLPECFVLDEMIDLGDPNKKANPESFKECRENKDSWERMIRPPIPHEVLHE
ncbi:MAG: ABC transporter ATP-binding protein [Deltaproteobacteria bacterium]|nr:ABC transporter ATP-binding protein [Deltaproteobacteria bacterium]